MCQEFLPMSLDVTIIVAMQDEPFSRRDMIGNRVCHPESQQPVIPILWPDLSTFETCLTAMVLHLIENRSLGSVPKVIGNVDQGHENGGRNILGLFCG